jgi:hypothetical protein
MTSSISGESKKPIAIEQTKNEESSVIFDLRRHFHWWPFLYLPIRIGIQLGDAR